MVAIDNDLLITGSSDGLLRYVSGCEPDALRVFPSSFSHAHIFLPQTALSMWNRTASWVSLASTASTPSNA